MMISVNINDGATPAAKAMIASLNGPGLVKAGADEVRVELREHFALLEQTRPNKNAWPRQHFWADVRQTVNAPVVASANTATVSITHYAINQRLMGGYIFPKNGKKYLTIPARPEAYGKKAAEIPGLRFGFAENKYGNLAPALVQTAAQAVKFGRTKKDGTRTVTPGAYGDAFYFLVKKVFQPADPSVLPTEAKIAAAAQRGANLYAEAMADRAAKGGSK